MGRRMKKVAGQIKYFNFDEVTEGDLLVEGTYNGEVQGDFGPQHEFREVETDAIVVIGGGHLNFLVDKYLETGDYCKVYFEGKDTLTKGRYKGKPVKKFSLEVEDRDDSAPAPKAAATPEPSGESEEAPWEAEEKAKEAKAKKKTVKKKRTKKAEPEPEVVAEDESDEDDDSMFEVD